MMVRTKSFGGKARAPPPSVEDAERPEAPPFSPGTATSNEPSSDGANGSDTEGSVGSAWATRSRASRTARGFFGEILATASSLSASSVHRCSRASARRRSISARSALTAGACGWASKRPDQLLIRALSSAWNAAKALLAEDGSIVVIAPEPVPIGMPPTARSAASNAARDLH